MLKGDPVHDRFYFLVEKYLATAMSDDECDELMKLLENNKFYQTELATNLVFESSVKDAIDARSALHAEIENGAEIKEFSNKDKKFKSKRFKNGSVFVKENQNDRQNKRKSFAVTISVAAILILGFTGYYLRILTSVPSVLHNHVKHDYVGTVELVRAEKTFAFSAIRALEVGDVIATSNASYAQFKTSEGSVFYLNEDSALELGSEGVKVLKGSFYADVARSEVAYFKKFYSGALSRFEIKGTAFEIIEDGSERSTLLSVKEGLVSFKQNGVAELVEKGKSLKAQHTGGFQEKRTIPNIHFVGSWIKYFKYLKDPKVICAENFDKKNLPVGWVQSVNSIESKIENKADHSVVELFVKGKEKTFIRTPVFELNKESAAICFSSKPPVGSVKVEYGYVIYLDGKPYLRQSSRILSRNDLGYIIKESCIENGVEKGKSQSFLVKEIPSIDLSVTLDLIEKVSEKKEIFYADQRVLPNVISENEVSSISIEFFVIGLAEDSQVSWALDSFVLTKEIGLSKMIREDFSK